jgi:HAMP domain-containing protein
MHTRTKLALCFILVSIGSMSLLGLFSYQMSADLLREISERQLEALVESKRSDLQKVIESWRDRVRLIRSRTQLRIDLARFNDAPTPETLAGIERILVDAQASTRSVRRITLFDANGRNIATAGSRVRPPGRGAEKDLQAVGFQEIYWAGSQANVVFNSALTLEDRPIGHLEVVFGADDLDTMTSDYTGLGQTGEVIIIVRDAADRAARVNRLRYAEATGSAAQDLSALAARASEVDHRVFEATDYRGKIVWAATRSIADPPWTVIVKLDEAEELARPMKLRRAMIDLGLALSAFSILGGTLLGFYLAAPIRRLTEVVERIRGGERELRANVDASDEVGFLSIAFNELIEDLQRQPVDP